MIESSSSSSKTKNRLILLFGMPRSGTTWLGKIFDSHRNTLYRHEPDSWKRIRQIPLFPELTDHQQYQFIVDKFIDDLPDIRSTKVSAKLPLFPKDYYSSTGYGLHKLSVLGAKFIENFYKGISIPIFFNPSTYPQLAIVWKSIESLGRIGTFARLLPEARFVILIRHPAGFIASILRGESQGNFSSKQSSSDDWVLFEHLLSTKQAKSRGLNLPDLKKMDPIERLTWKWVIYNEKAMEETSGLDSCKVLRYEDLCMNPMDTANMLFKHAHLPWCSQTAEFLMRSTSSNQNSYYSVYKNPAVAAAKWKNELSNSQIKLISEITKNTKPGLLFNE